MAGLGRKRLPWILGAACLILVVITGREAQRFRQLQVYQRAIRNRSILTLRAAAEIPEATFARAWMLSRNGQGQEALMLYETLGQSRDPVFRARVKYQIGALLLRQATDLLEEQGPPAVTKVAPLIEIAKEALREVLRYDSRDREAKYNLELALRLLPEPERVDRARDEEAKEEEGDWTSIPGLPEGMP